MGRGEFLEFDDEPFVPVEEAGRTAVIRDHIYYLERANQCLMAGECEQALRYYSRSLDQCLQLEEAWVGQCLALLDMGEPAQAQLWAEKALLHCPGSAACFSVRAIGLMREGLMEKAMGFLDAALKVKRNHWLPWMGRAEALLVEGKTALCEQCLEKAFEAGGVPRWWMLRRAGEMLLIHDEPRRAVQYLLKAVDLEPKEALNHLRVAQAFHLLNKRSEAKEYLDQALLMRPDLVEARRLREKMENQGIVSRLIGLVRK